MDPFIHNPAGVLWEIEDSDSTQFPSNPAIPDAEVVLRADWGPEGNPAPIAFCVELTFEGFKKVKSKPGVSVGVISLVMNPKDAVFALGLKQKPNFEGAKSPRDRFKTVATWMAQRPMFAGARVTMAAAHCGEHGIKYFEEYDSGFRGFPRLMEIRQREISRAEARLNPLDRMLRRLSCASMTDLKPLLPLTGEDPWDNDKTRESFGKLFQGVGMDAGDGRLGMASLMRKLQRDTRVDAAVRRFGQSGPQTICAPGAESSGPVGSGSTSTMLYDPSIFRG